MEEIYIEDVLRATRRKGRSGGGKIKISVIWHSIFLSLLCSAFHSLLLLLRLWNWLPQGCQFIRTPITHNSATEECFDTHFFKNYFIISCKAQQKLKTRTNCIIHIFGILLLKIHLKPKANKLCRTTFSPSFSFVWPTSGKFSCLKHINLHSLSFEFLLSCVFALFAIKIHRNWCHSCWWLQFPPYSFLTSE
jgi:hypothetical protein